MLCCNVIHAWAVQRDCAAQACQYVWEIRGGNTSKTGMTARSRKQSGAKVQLVRFYAVAVTKVCYPHGAQLVTLYFSLRKIFLLFFF